MLFAYYLHDLSPFVFKFTDKIAIHWYGLAYVLGFYLTYRVMHFLALRGLSEIKPDAVADFIWLHREDFTGVGRQGGKEEKCDELHEGESKRRKHS